MNLLTFTKNEVYNKHEMRNHEDERMKLERLKPPYDDCLPRVSWDRANVAAVQRVAGQEGISVSEVVRQAVLFFLREYDSQMNQETVTNEPPALAEQPDRPGVQGADGQPELGGVPSTDHAAG